MKASDFDKVKLIGRGGFGEVKLVKHRLSQKYYAMKTQRKAKLSRHPLFNFWEEHKILSFSNSAWLMKLHYAFQDEYNLYMVMDFMAGGDLLNLIINYHMTEDTVRFYAAEMVLAVDALHKMGYIHCDIKLENFLIAADGHIKLNDFGLSLKMNAWDEVPVSVSGTTDLLPPEVLTKIYRGKVSDWWTVGLCIYEMITEDMLFHSKSVRDILKKINQFLADPQFPGVELSAEAKNLLLSLLTTKDRRLGARGVNEIILHPFFKNPIWNFDTIRETRPPFVPELSSDCDIRYIRPVNEKKDALSQRKTEVDGHYTGFTLYNCPFKECQTGNALMFSQQEEDDLENQTQKSQGKGDDWRYRFYKVQEEQDLRNHHCRPQEENSNLENLVSKLQRELANLHDQRYNLQREKLQRDQDLAEILTLTKGLMDTSGESQKNTQAMMSDMDKLENENKCLKNTLRKMQYGVSEMKSRKEKSQSLFQMNNQETPQVSENQQKRGLVCCEKTKGQKRDGIPMSCRGVGKHGSQVHADSQKMCLL